MIPAVEARGIRRRFGRVVANDDVDLVVAPGEVRALVGENGAGKSTLVRILAGFDRPDGGTVRIRGEALLPGDPARAMARGVGLVHQHFTLVDPLTVAENLVLGREPRRWGLLDRGAARRAVEAAAATFGLAADPDARCGDLSVGEKQRVEVLKVLHRGAEILVLDEPTAVLAPPEVAPFLDLLRRLAAGGRTVILVTHRLDEVMSVADRVTVLRGGRVVAEEDVRATDPARLARLMVGDGVDLAVDRRPTGVTGPPALAVRGLVVRRDGRPAVDGVDLAVRAGEVVGIAGVAGNGQSELLDALAGLRPVAAGTVHLGGQDVTGAPPEARRARGLALVPEDRGDRGLVGDLSLAENLLLGRPEATPPWRRGGRRAAAALLEGEDVRPPDPDLPARALSGGNAQKLLVARELARSPRVLLAGQPTRGVDVGAAAHLHRRILAARDEGAAVLLVSGDLGEVLRLSDRVLVMVHGRVVAELSAAEATRDRVGAAMAGLVGGAA